MELHVSGSVVAYPLQASWAEDGQQLWGSRLPMLLPSSPAVFLMDLPGMKAAKERTKAKWRESGWRSSQGDFWLDNELP